MYKLRLEHGFSSAHRLTNAYSNECNDYVHGHNWKVLIELETEELHNGMVLDFKRIKEEINELDHRYLNDIIDFEPTAENLSKYIYLQVKELYFEKHGKDPASLSITLWEADKASITYTK